MEALYEKRMRQLIEKFGLDKLELSDKASADYKWQTVRDFVTERERESQRNYQLAYGSTTWTQNGQEREVFLGLDISRRR